MATLFITEYERLARDANGNSVLAGEEPAVTTQTVSYTTSTQSAALNKRTRFVFLQTDGTKAHIVFANNPTATSSSPPLPSTAGYFYGVNYGEVQGTLKIAAYDGTS